MTDQPTASQTPAPDTALRDARVLNDEDLLYGLPSRVFIPGAAVSLLLSIMMVWWSGPLFAYVYFSVMYPIHASDPKAYLIWSRALIKPTCYRTNSQPTRHYAHI